MTYLHLNSNIIYLVVLFCTASPHLSRSLLPPHFKSACISISPLESISGFQYLLLFFFFAVIICLFIFFFVLSLVFTPPHFPQLQYHSGFKVFLIDLEARRILKITHKVSNGIQWIQRAHIRAIWMTVAGAVVQKKEDVKKKAQICSTWTGRCCRCSHWGNHYEEKILCCKAAEFIKWLNSVSDLWHWTDWQNL